MAEDPQDFVRDMASGFSGAASRSRTPSPPRRVSPNQAERSPRGRSGDDNRRRNVGNIGKGLTGWIDRSDRALADRYGRDLEQRLSRLGVDPRSPEGQEILVLVEGGMPFDSPEIGDLVDAYQESLIGPMSKRNRSGTRGGYENEYGYRAGEEFTLLDSLSTEMLARVQDRMAALGMVEGYLPGRKDPRTVEAFKDLLWMSNSEGRSWSQMLGDLERQKEEMGDDWAWDADGSGDRAEFVAPTYLAPDYATLAQTVKQQLRTALGRDPDESEMALLTAELSGWDRDAFEVEADAMRAEWEAAEDGRDVSPTVQQVDPAARFKESFESKFAAELSGIKRTEEATVAGDAARGAVGIISQMSGGMG